MSGQTQLQQWRRTQTYTHSGTKKTGCECSQLNVQMERSRWNVPTRMVKNNAAAFQRACGRDPPKTERSNGNVPFGWERSRLLRRSLIGPEQQKNPPCRHGQNFKILGRKCFGSFMVSNDRPRTPEDRLLVQTLKMRHSLSNIEKNFVSLVMGLKNKKN